jgi:hypothetical protein
MKVCVVGASGKLGRYMLAMPSSAVMKSSASAVSRASASWLSLWPDHGRSRPDRRRGSDQGGRRRLRRRPRRVGAAGHAPLLVWNEQAVLVHAKPDARLVFSCGWHVSLDGQDVYSLRYKALVKAAGLLGRVTPTVDLDDQVEACRRVFESDTRWTVVRGSDMEEGESEGLPVWSRHVGNPILESNINRRIDFARLRPVHGRHARPRTRRRRSSVARALQLSLAARLERGNRVPQSQSRSHLRGVRSPFQRPQHTESGPLDFCFPAECASRSSREAAGNRMTASSLSAGVPTRADQFAGPSARCSGVQSGSRACGQAKTSMRSPSGSKTKNA